MPDKVWARWREFCRLSPGEFSALATAERVGKAFKLVGLYPPKQWNSGASTTMDESDVPRILTQLVRDNLPPPNVWIHDHHTMAPFWSGTDEQNIRDIGQGAKWLLSIVTNKKGSYKARLDIFEPVRITIHEVTLSIDYYLEADALAAIKAEYDACIISAPTHKPKFEMEKEPDSRPINERRAFSPKSAAVDRLVQMYDEQMMQLESELETGAIDHEAFMNRYMELEQKIYVAESQR